MHSDEKTYSFVVVSNRLPVRRNDVNSDWTVAPGGLVSAVKPVVAELGCAWIGWSGDIDDEEPAFTLDGMHLVPVALTGDDVEQFYEGFCNDTVWPLFHDFTEVHHFDRENWRRYVSVNMRFAQKAAQIADRSATVWIHDYHLMLVPELLRRLRPDLSIGFFLHIPFPALSIFARLPWRREVLRGLLGADVVGVQTAHDAHNVRNAITALLSECVRSEQVYLPPRRGEVFRTVTVRDFAISIDVAAFAQLAADEAVRERARQIRHELADPKLLILGVDRLDYTKGIRHRLRAFGELFETGFFEPGDAVLLQVASPSREGVPAYQALREEIEQTVGRINGEYSNLQSNPIHYQHREVDQREMVALYLAADVLMVTSLRDGMNLVAKEYVASRSDESGMLVLSEFAGAAAELTQAIIVNPHDIDDVKAALRSATTMSQSTIRHRMRSMREHLALHDVQRWAHEFMTALAVNAQPDVDATAEVVTAVS